MQQEPAVIIAAIVSLLSGVFFWVTGEQIPPEVQTALVVVIVFLTGVIIRRFVFAPATVEELSTGQ